MSREKEVTIYDIADKLNVSIATVSRALKDDPVVNKKTKKKIFDRGEEHINFTNVLIDNRKAAYDATKHLIEQGCKKIVHITAKLKRNVYVDRFKGYKQALAEHDLPFEEDFVMIGNLSLEAGTL